MVRKMFHDCFMVRNYDKKNRVTVRIMKRDKKNGTMLRSMKLRLKQRNFGKLNKRTSKRTKLQSYSYKIEGTII